MKFAKAAWKLIVAVKDGLVLVMLMLFFALLYAGLKAARAQDHVPREGALLIALDGPVVEQPADVDRLSALSGNGTAPEYRLRDVVRAIETAAKDKAIKAVVLDLDGFGGGGQVAMERIGAALDKVRAANKPVIAHSGLYDDDAYLVASHASEIWLSPIGTVGVTGPGGTQLFYKGLMDKVGARAHIYRVGTFKSAVEPYLLEKQSDEARTANQALVDAVWSEWLAHVGKARAKAKVTAFLRDPMAVLSAAGGDAAKAAMNMGLVDKLGDEIAFGKRAADLAGEGDGGAPGDFAAIPLKTYLARHPAAKGGGVGVITVAGDIVDGEAGAGTAGGISIANHIRDAMADDSIKALVLRVDSPGGEVTGAEDIRSALAMARKQGLPVVVSMGNVAASGGYWVSTAADTIYAEPATITGSIGVFGILPSFETTLAKVGITSDGVKATPLSGEPDIVGGVSPQFDALAQASVEDVYRRFVGLVASARKMKPERVDTIAQGRVWDGGTARQLGLVDRFGGIEDAIAEAARRAHLSGDKARAHYFDPPADELTTLLAMFNDEHEAEEARLHARAAPRDWLSLASLRQRQWAAQVLADLDGFMTGAAIRVQCLECRAYGAPLAPVRPSDARGLGAVLGRVSALIGFAE